MMKSDAFQRAVDGFKHRQPFQPFVVELDDGERLLVEQPEVLHCFAGSALHYPPGGRMTLVDAEDVKHVLEFAAAPPS